MTHPTWLDIALSLLIVGSAFVWVVASAAYHTERVLARIRAWQAMRGTAPSVDVTLNQMYGDVNVDTHGAEYRKARHARIESQQGGKH